MKTRLLGAIALLCLPILALAQDDAAAAEDDRVVFFQYAIYLLPGYEGDPVATATALIENNYSQFAIVESLDEPLQQPVIGLFLLNDVKQQYVAPDLQSIGYFGRGVTREQALAVQETDDALVINFAYPIRFGNTAFHDALELMEALALEHSSLIWDEATRQVFSREAWRELRLDSWNDGVFSIQDHITIHAYKNGEFVRAITLGMEKFGLPDIVVNDFGWSSSRPMGNLINLVAQTLLEGGDIGDDLSLVVDIGQLKHAPTREELEASLLENASGRLTLYLKPAVPEEGDPDKYLLAIRFDNVDGLSVQEQQDELLGKLFGWEDSIVYVDHNKKILEASERARKKLPELRRDFNAGLEPGEFIHVKAPFATPDGGNEWMWVEVIEWDGSRIRGLLENEPFNVPDLRGGEEVIVNEEDLFDYIRFFPDGTEEGNETGALIREAQQR